MNRTKPLDFIVGMVAVGCFLLLAFAREEAARTGGVVLMNLVSYYIGRKHSNGKIEP